VYHTTIQIPETTIEGKKLSGDLAWMQQAIGAISLCAGFLLLATSLSDTRRTQWESLVAQPLTAIPRPTVGAPQMARSSRSDGFAMLRTTTYDTVDSAHAISSGPVPQAGGINANNGNQSFGQSKFFMGSVFIILGVASVWQQMCRKFASAPISESLHASLDEQAIAAFAVTGESSPVAVADDGKMWQFVMTVDDLAKQPNKRAQGTVDGVELALITEGSTVWAVQAKCPHLGIPLAGGKVENGVITCSQHKSSWSCDSGESKDWLPGGGVNAVQRLVSKPCDLATYETKIEDGKIFVNLLPKQMSVAMFAVTSETVPPADDGKQWSFVMTTAALDKQPNRRAQGTVDGVQIALLTEGSNIYAVQAKCPHLGIPLAGGKVENGVITCSQHKSSWSCDTGEVNEWLPGGGVNAVQRLVSKPCTVATYKTKVEDGKIYINLNPY
jgi:nitrite reductase/ring-hydroxylating ferredoxin subunit